MYTQLSKPHRSQYSPNLTLEEPQVTAQVTDLLGGIEHHHTPVQELQVTDLLGVVEHHHPRGGGSPDPPGMQVLHDTELVGGLEHRLPLGPGSLGSVYRSSMPQNWLEV